MKRTLVGLAAMLVMFQAAGAARATDQPAWTSVVATVNFEDAPMGGILGTLEKAAGFVVRVDKDLMPDLEHKLTIRIEHAPMGEILSSLLATRKLSYRILDEKTVEIIRQ